MTNKNPSYRTMNKKLKGVLAVIGFWMWLAGVVIGCEIESPTILLIFFVGIPSIAILVGISITIYLGIANE